MKKKPVEKSMKKKDILKLYRKECNRWIKFFGLHGYEVYFEIENNPDVYGRCSTNQENKLSILTVSQSCCDKKEVKKTAFHEVCELLVANMYNLSLQREGFSMDRINESRHELIRILEHTIYRKMRK